MLGVSQPVLHRWIPTQHELAFEAGANWSVLPSTGARPGSEQPARITEHGLAPGGTNGEKTLLELSSTLRSGLSSSETPSGCGLLRGLLVSPEVVFGAH